MISDVGSHSNNEIEDKIAPLTVAPSTSNQSKKLLIKQRIAGKVPQILKALELVTKIDAILIPSKQKAAPRGISNSRRRSSFIGVFKNGPNWQALISIDKKKTYIGTYKDEEKAARAFDYHSILLNNLTAVTNFDYSKTKIEKLFREFSSTD
jgi:hypothetical protein